MDPSYTNLLTANINDNTVPDLIIIYPSSVSKDANFPNITHAYHHNVQFKYQIIYDLHLATTHHGSYRGLRNSRPFIKPSESSFSNSFDAFELECESEYIDGVWANYNFPLSFTSTVTDFDSNGRPDVVIVSVVRNIGVLQQGFAIKVIVVRNFDNHGEFESITYNDRILVVESSGSFVHSDVGMEYPFVCSVQTDHGFGGFSVLTVTHSLGESKIGLERNGSIISSPPPGLASRHLFLPVEPLMSVQFWYLEKMFVLSVDRVSSNTQLFRTDVPFYLSVPRQSIQDDLYTSIVEFHDLNDPRPSFISLQFGPSLVLSVLEY
ncbi:hypothetical protein RCL1_006171 [Eukaryota sp. TZLM3-RCL]